MAPEAYEGLAAVSDGLSGIRKVEEGSGGRECGKGQQVSYSEDTVA